MTANTTSPKLKASYRVLLLNHLMTGATINTLQALELYQCFSCSQRLGELRRDRGIPIESQFITLPNGKRIKNYWLEPSYIQLQQVNRKHEQ